MDTKKEKLQHCVAFNGFRGGNKGSVCSQGLSGYDKAISLPWLHEMVMQIRGEKPIRGVNAGDKRALDKEQRRIKGNLPFRCAHYYRFEGNHRRQNCIVPESFLFQTTVDVDDQDRVADALERARELNCSQGIWNGMLLHLEYSARKKLHIDIRMPIGMTIEEAQRAYCEAIGVPCDESCFSPERIIFMTDKDSEIYRSKHWYEVLPEEELKIRRQAFLDRGLSIDGRGKAKFPFAPVSEKSEQKGVAVAPSVASPAASKEASPAASKEASPAASKEASPAASTVAGTSSPSSKNLAAFDLFVQSAGLKDVNIDSQGSRHSSLLAIMSAGASRVMSEEELKGVVAVRMPSFYQERDCQQLIHDFYAKYGDSSKPMSREVIRINALAEKQETVSCEEKDEEPDYPAPPDMPEHLPKLVALLISKTPKEYQPAVANAIFPPLATHLWQTRFNYIDNVEHEATLMCCLLAGTGAGKSCVQQPINHIMADIRQRDQENLSREKDWKDEVIRKGANKDKRKRPQNLIIQEIDADMTNPAFVMRTAEADGHFLYTSLNEIDQFDALKGIGNQQFRIMCYAFDPGNQYGQTRVGTQSVTERVTVRFNWNASTTIEMGQRYFSKVLTNGPLSRINFCTIPEREIGEEMPVYGVYDAAFDEQLRPYIENLCKVTGLIDCPEAFALAKKLRDENAEFSRLSQDRIYENFSFRANVIGYLKACVLYVANGCQWEPEIEDFIRWSERYDLYCKMRFFADAIKKHNDLGEKSSKRGPSNLLQLLPDIFNSQEVNVLRQKHGLGSHGTKQMLKNWLSRGYIKKKSGKDGFSFSSFSFEKLRYRKDGLVLND